MNQVWKTAITLFQDLERKLLEFISKCGENKQKTGKSTKGKQKLLCERTTQFAEILVKQSREPITSINLCSDYI